MEAPVYNAKGEKAGSVAVPESVFGRPWNGDLVHQVVAAMQANARGPVAHAKGRGEVSGGGKKPWRQKGTGRARHGSIRSPLWRHGGVTHGPLSERSYAQKINKKMKGAALAAVLSRKLKEGEVLFVDELSFAKPATKEAAGVLSRLASIEGFKKLSYKRGNRALIAMQEKSEAAEKSFRNIPSVRMDTASGIDPVKVLAYNYLVIVAPSESLAILEKRHARRK